MHLICQQSRILLSGNLQKGPMLIKITRSIEGTLSSLLLRRRRQQQQQQQAFIPIYGIGYMNPFLHCSMLKVKFSFKSNKEMLFLIFSNQVFLGLSLPLLRRATKKIKNKTQ